jgi:dienelactone hydrolase
MALFFGRLLAVLATVFTYSSAGASDVDGTWTTGAFVLPRELANELHTPTRRSARIDKFWPELSGARPGKKYPLAIVMHGCMGLTTENAAAGRLLADNGFVVFMPNYYARGTATPRCGGSAAGVPYFAALDRPYLKERSEEFANAVDQARKLAFVDDTVLVALGHSMGGATVAQLNRTDITAAIITGWGCPNGYSDQLPPSVPQLSMRFEDDPWLSPGYCGTRLFGARQAENTVNIVLTGQRTHEVMQSDLARQKIVEFLDKFVPRNSKE